MRISAKTLSAVAGVALAVAFQGFPQSQLRAPDVTVQLKYVASNGSVVEVFGVCHVTETSVECWDGLGKPHLRLAEAIENSLKSGEFGSTVSLRYGKKNRFIVVRTMRPQGRSGLYIDTSKRNGSYGGSYGLKSIVDDVSSNVYLDYKVIRMYFDNDATETFVELTERINLNTTISISHVDGEEFSLNGVSYVLGKVTKAQSSGSRQSAPAWLISVSSDGKARRSFSYSAIAIGKDGEAIQYIDEKGRPLSVAENDERLGKLQQSGSGAVGFGAGGFGIGGFGPGIFVSVSLPDDGRPGYFRTGIDPKYIKEIRITPTWVRRIRIEGIPLDPID